ncbi:hypothetical protein [Ectobacillus antri]|uniref:capsular polysaccharide export protein, LipB/KpsS family n=1 Tax=Ectobacillus antri TaxID=2486280 RepID=UPI000F59C28F|nr:hypothetical protein [Ectobacillus antri]
MGKYLFLRGNRNKRFFLNIANQLEKAGHTCFQIKFELGELLFKNTIETAFAPFHVSRKAYPISDETLLSMPIYNITYRQTIMKKQVSPKELLMYKRYMYFIDQFIEKHDIDRICLFNGFHWIDQVTKYIAEQRGIQLYYFEDGLFRPYTVTCDSAGINAQASIPRNASFYDDLQIDKERLKKFLFHPENPVFLNNHKESLGKTAAVKAISMLGSVVGLHPSFYVHITWKLAIKYFLHKQLFKYRKSNAITIPEEYIFLPFQVARDSQIFYNSPYIKNMEELLDVVYDAITIFNQKHNRHLCIVVKEHPEDLTRNDYRELKMKYASKKEVIFVQKYDVKKLISKAEAVVTINSTVGIEALAQYKRVITLGDAMYNIEGVATHTPPHMLLSTLEHVLTLKVNKQRIQKFLYYLRFHYQVEGTINSIEDDTAKNVVHRLMTSPRN